MNKWLGLIVFCIVLHVGGSASAIEGLTGSTWGTVIHNFDSADRLLVMGNLNQGIDWFEVKGVRFTTFAELRWRYLAPDGEFFNAWAPALGVSLSKWGLRLGAEYAWEKKFNEPDDNRALIFVDWYYGWDLKKLFK